jgi:integrative and conjugative element protein (TIGR02256 family)
MADMRAEALRTALRFPRRWETGGILLGYFDDACRVAWATAAESPPPDSERGENFLWHGTEGVARSIARHRQASGGRVRFIGMWHTHPGMVTRASPTDDQAMRNLLIPLPTSQVPRRAIQVILGGEGEKWDYWLQGAGQPDIGFCLYRRSQVLAADGPGAPEG